METIEMGLEDVKASLEMWLAARGVPNDAEYEATYRVINGELRGITIRWAPSLNRIPER